MRVRFTAFSALSVRLVPCSPIVAQPASPQRFIICPRSSTCRTSSSSTATCRRRACLAIIDCNKVFLCHTFFSTSLSTRSSSSQNAKSLCRWPKYLSTFRLALQRVMTVCVVCRVSAARHVVGALSAQIDQQHCSRGTAFAGSSIRRRIETMSKPCVDDLCRLAAVDGARLEAPTRELCAADDAQRGSF